MFTVEYVTSNGNFLWLSRDREGNFDGNPLSNFAEHFPDVNSAMTAVSNIQKAKSLDIKQFDVVVDGLYSITHRFESWHGRGAMRVWMESLQSNN